jgi:polar amino acid transport system substrate-binding protein
MGVIFRWIKSTIPIFFCLAFMSCGGQSSDFDYKVALDPAWYSLDLPGRESNITAFTCELIEEIGKIEKVKIAVYQRSWSNLVYGLQENDYNAICTTMQPYLFYEKLYDFSDLYLMTGPVLVTAVDSRSVALNQLAGKEIGIIEGSNSALILEKYPNILQRTYDSIPAALSALRQGAIDGAVVDILTAEAFTQDLFQGQLKITTPPLTQEGIRLVAIKGHAPNFMKMFNRGLARLKENGTYSALAKKWKLSEPINSSK